MTDYKQPAVEQSPAIQAIQYWISKITAGVWAAEKYADHFFMLSTAARLEECANSLMAVASSIRDRLENSTRKETEV